MESKAAERVQGNAEASAIATTLIEDKQEEEAMKVIRCDDNATPARLSWANVKSRARSFGEYAILRTRQGISMFGEPKLESLIKGADAEADSR